MFYGLPESGSAALPSASVSSRASAVSRRAERRRAASHYVEPLEGRRLLSTAPFRPDLVAAADTGVSDADNVTRYDNTTFPTALHFLVGDTVPGALVTLYLDNIASGTATATSPSTLVSLNPETKVADGVHAVTARQTAPGDTESVDSPSLSFTVDTAPPADPAAPDLQPASDTGASSTDNLTRDTTPTFTVAAGAYYLVRQDDTVLAGFRSGPTYTATATANRMHRFAVLAADVAGNVSQPSAALDVTIDTGVPTATLADPPAEVVPGGSVYTFSVAYADPNKVDPTKFDGQDVGVVAPNGTVHPAPFVSAVALDGGARQVVTYRFTPPGGTWDYPDNGMYLIRLNGSQVVDLAGNAAEVAYLGSVYVNLLAQPAAPDLLPAADTGVSSTDNVTRFDNGAPDRALRFLVRNTKAGATVTLFADGTVVGSTVAQGPEATVSTDGSFALPAGYYTFHVRQRLPGEAPPDSPPLGVTIDVTPPPRPVAPDLESASDTGVSDTDNLTNDNTPTLSIALTLAPYYRVNRNGEVFADSAAGDAFTSPPLGDGVHAFTVTAVDSAGNVSEASPALQITVDTVAPPPGMLAGMLDTTFDADGRRYFDGGGNWHSAVVQPDGKTLLAGATVGATGRPLLTRLNPDGSTDATFGVEGVVSVGSPDRAYVALMPDGRIVLADAFSVRRLSSSGQVDVSYGTNGSARVDFPIRDAAVDADGRVLVTGIVQTTDSGDQFATVRLNLAGLPDPTFGGTGRVVTAVSPRGGNAYAVAAAPDGKVLVAGYGGSDVTVGYRQHNAVVRYNPDGSLDTSFAGSGVATHRLFFGSEVHNVDVAPDGRILISGVTFDGEGSQFDHGFVARLRPDGSLDPTFGVDGVQTIPGNRAAGGWLPGGYALLATTQDGGFAFGRFDPSGNADPAVPGGFFISPKGTSNGLTLMGHAVAPDGKVLLVGADTSNLNTRLAVYRLQISTFGVPDLRAESDTGVSATDNLTNDATPTFDISPSGAEGGLYQRLFRDGVRISGEYEPVGAYTAAAQPDGTWSYASAFVDAAGNASPAGPALTVRIDTVAPQVSGAFIAASSWTPAFTGGLQSTSLGTAAGFALPVTGGTEAAPLPWANLDRITLRLSEPVSLRQSDLRVQSLADSGPAVTSFVVDAAGTSAVWTLSRPLAQDRLLLSLGDTIGDAAGNLLRVTPALAGSAAAPFVTRLNVLPGDADRSGAVTAADLVRTRGGLGVTSAGGNSRAYSPFYDFDGNGRITASDYALARARLLTRLPTPPPVTVTPQPAARSARLSYVPARTPLLADTKTPLSEQVG